MAELQIGRDMDAAVAIAALGWKWAAFDYPTLGLRVALYSPEEQARLPLRYDDLQGIPREECWDEGLPDFWHSDADSLAALDAWMVAHPMWSFEISFDPREVTRGWKAFASMWTPDKGINLYDFGTVRYGPTRPAAICAAILALSKQETET
jgi:hypothetical protein